MSRLLASLRLLLLLGLLSPFLAASLSALEPTKEMETIARITSTIMSKKHYTQHPLDDSLSTQLFDEYFKTLDPNKTFFTKKDIEKFQELRLKLDDQLAAGNLSFPFELFNLYISRLDSYEAATKEFLDKGFDFNVNEEFQFNRTKADWAPNEEALKEIWRKKIKNDVLSLMIADKASKEDPDFVKKPSDKKSHVSWSPKSPEERVRKRVAQFVQYSRQLEPIDVLEFYLTSLAHVYDPHSSYMSPRSEEDFNISMRLSLVGIGALLSSEDGYTKIEKIIPGGPAEREGSLGPGDRIVAVAQDGGEPVDIMDMPLSKVVNLIRGKKDTKVTLTVLDAAKGVNSVPHTITIVRNTVMLTESEAKGSIRKVKGPNGRECKIGVITLPSFYMDFDAAYKGDADYKSSTRDVAKFLEQFKAAGVDGVILDLRSNGGGSLLEAVTLTGLFIKAGPVVQVKDLDDTEVKSSDSGVVAYDGPLAVMVNRMSASAAEIFAAAIKDYNRGVIIGDSKTHGKGTVQALIDIKSILAFIGAKFPAGSLKLTNAKFYRINGASTQLKGVTPDISFPSFTDSMEIGEEKLDHAMKWDCVPPVNYSVWSESFPSIIPALKERSGRRLAASKEFQGLMMDIEAYNKIRDRKSVSLNFNVRWQEYLNEKKIQDEQAKLMKLDDESQAEAKGDKKKEEKDLYLDESLNIIADMVSAIPARQPAQASVKAAPKPSAP